MVYIKQADHKKRSMRRSIEETCFPSREATNQDKGGPKAKVKVKTKDNDKEPTFCWKQRSDLLCWYCCHQFGVVPAYLPTSYSSSPSCISFTGNFCSWNCVKAYYLQYTEGKRKADIIHVITLLAFITSYRPSACPEPFSQHTHDCSCLDNFTGISLPPHRNNLKSFGGKMSIEDFRDGFLVVKNVSVINTLANNQTTSRTFSTLLGNRSIRSYIYKPFDAVEDRKCVERNELISPPKVEPRFNIRQSTLL